MPHEYTQHTLFPESQVRVRQIKPTKKILIERLRRTADLLESNHEAAVDILQYEESESTIEIVANIK